MRESFLFLGGNYAWSSFYMSTLAYINLIGLTGLNGDIRAVIIREPTVMNRGENQTKRVKSVS